MFELDRDEWPETVQPKPVLPFHDECFAFSQPLSRFKTASRPLQANVECGDATKASRHDGGLKMPPLDKGWENARVSSWNGADRLQRWQARHLMEVFLSEFNLLLLPGDGIGPEVMAETRRVLEWFNTHGEHQFHLEEDLVGGAAYDVHGVAITDATMEKALQADAVLFGAVGGPKWDEVPYEHRPEAGLLRLRKELQLFANLRPAICYPALADGSPLKREVVEGLDILIVRELTGGVYFGEPKEITETGNGKRAVDTQVYETYEIERIARVAFDLARKRANRVHSAEKRNVMMTGVLWHEVVSRVHEEEFPDVTLEHILADNCAMQLVRWPKQFDVIVTDNLFGDILSDAAAMLTGSLGMLPSASLGAEDDKGRRKALYEPVHGSAPDIAGKGQANPIAMIGSLGMALRYSFGMVQEAELLDRAIADVLAQGLRTADIMAEGMTLVSTRELGQAVLDALAAQARKDAGQAQEALAPKSI